MLDALGYVTGICCDQDNPDLCQIGNKFPDSYRNKRCALAMNETSKACIPWLEEPEQKFYDDLLKRMRAAQKQSDTYLSNDTQPLWIPINQQAVKQPNSVCGATLVSGDITGENTSFKGEITLQAPPGLTLELRFVSLWLPEGTKLEFWDGSDSKAAPLAPVSGLSGTTEQLQSLHTTGPIVSTGRALHIKHTDDSNKVGDAKTYSAEISCKCASDDSCGTHKTGNGSPAKNGECKRGSCHCFEGYQGDTCAEVMCDTIDKHVTVDGQVGCGAHGLCAYGKCFCSGNYTGDYCELEPQCAPRTLSRTCSCETDYGGERCGVADPTLTVTNAGAASCPGSEPCYNEDGHENEKIRYRMNASSTDDYFVIHYVGDGWQLDHHEPCAAITDTVDCGKVGCVWNETETKCHDGSSPQEPPLEAVEEMYYNPDRQSRPPVVGWVDDGNPFSVSKSVRVAYKDGWRCDSPVVNGSEDGSCGQF